VKVVGQAQPRPRAQDTGAGGDGFVFPRPVAAGSWSPARRRARWATRSPRPTSHVLPTLSASIWSPRRRPCGSAKAAVAEASAGPGRSFVGAGSGVPSPRRRLHRGAARRAAGPSCHTEPASPAAYVFAEYALGVNALGPLGRAPTVSTHSPPAASRLRRGRRRDARRRGRQSLIGLSALDGGVAR